MPRSVQTSRSRRSHVVANSEEIDAWLRHRVAMRSERLNLSAHLERARTLRAEAQQVRHTLREKLEVLTKEVAAARAAAQQLQRDRSR